MRVESDCAQVHVYCFDMGKREFYGILGHGLYVIHYETKADNAFFDK